MQTRRSKRLTLGVLAALLGALALTVTVSAHSQLIRSEPAANALLANAPAQVKLFFDEAVNVAFSDVQVLDKNLRRVDNADLSLVPGDARQLVITLKPLGDGTYSVVWQVLSDVDGHMSRGNFAFGVGTGSQAAPVPVTLQSGPGETDPLPVAVRGLSWTALLALAGGVFFHLVLLERSLQAVPMPTSAQDRLRANWWLMIGAALGLALITQIATLLVESSLVSGVPPAGLSGNLISRTLLATRFGTLWIARSVLLIVLGLALGMSGSHRTARWAALALSFGILMTISLGGHSAAVGSGVSLALFADWLHLMGVSVWVGGLFNLLMALLTVWRLVSSETRTRWLAWMVPQFSAIALPATAVIALTGLYNSLQQVPALEALIRTAYGETLTIKVALFGVMMVMGAINLLFLSPRFHRAALDVPLKGTLRLASRFRVTVAFEVMLGLAVIFLAGRLTLEPPARTSIQRPLTQAAAPPQPLKLSLRDTAAPDVHVALTLQPPTENTNEFDAYVTDPSTGVPITRVLRVMLQFTLLDQDIGITTQIAESHGDGHYAVHGSMFTLPGLWRLRVIVRRAGVEDVSVEFPLYRPVDNAQDTPNDPPAMQWLIDSDAAMNQLTSLRSKQNMNDGNGGVLVTEYEYRAPNAIRLTAQTGAESIALGPAQYDRDKNGQWTQRQRIEPFVFPKFNLSMQVASAKMGRQETLNGEPAQIVRFTLPVAGGSSEQYAEWISTKDRRTLQLAMVAPSHFMMQSYRDYDSPQVAVAAPPTGQIAAPAPAPVAAKTALPPVLNERNLLWGGAVALLAGGIVLGLMAINQRQAKRRRVILLALGLPLIIGSVGVSIRAATARPALDVSTNAPGKPFYDANCAGCHGSTGHGDGPVGKSLPVAPFDLTTHVLQHDEQYLDVVITNGRGYMPAFKDQLTQDQIYQVIAYTRLLALKARREGAQ